MATSLKLKNFHASPPMDGRIGKRPLLVLSRLAINSRIWTSLGIKFIMRAMSLHSCHSGIIMLALSGPWEFLIFNILWDSPTRTLSTRSTHWSTTQTKPYEAKKVTNPSPQFNQSKTKDSHFPSVACKPATTHPSVSPWSARQPIQSTQWPAWGSTQASSTAFC